MSPDSLVELGLLGLFVAAFLAGSILPFASEAVLTGLLLVGVGAPSAVSTATAGNVLGALTVYAIGRYAGGGALRRRFMRRLGANDPKRAAAADERIARWGPLVLLFSWVPVLGDALVLAAGLAKLDARRVLLFVALGKGARYCFVAWAVSKAAGG